MPEPLDIARPNRVSTAAHSDRVGHRPGDPAPHIQYEHNAASIPDGDPDNEFREWSVCSDCGGDVDGQPPDAVHV